MLHFENIPFWVPIALGVFGLVMLAPWVIDRRRRRHHDRAMGIYRARHKGEEMAWKLRWAPRPRRLTHQPGKDGHREG